MTIVIVGCGRVGAGVARDLGVRQRDVTVVDPDPAALERVGPTFAGDRVLGSALDQDVLDRAGVAHADALAAVTGDDAVNVVVARAARAVYRVPRVVARLYDPRKAEIYDRLGIRTLSYVAWGVRRIADLLTATTIAPAAELGSGDVEIVDVHVPALLVGRQAGEVEVPGELAVVAVTRHGRTALASPAFVLEADDVIHVAVMAAALGRLETLLGHA
jgi:trk system potassium uptake protein